MTVVETEIVTEMRDADVRRLFAVARLAIAEEIASGRDHRPADLPISDADPRHVVNITILLRGALRASMAGRGATLRDAVDSGARRSAHDSRFAGMLTPAELRDATLELWVQRVDEPLSPSAAVTTLDLGVDGVKLSRDGQSAYYKPSVALTSAVAGPVWLLRRLVKKAGLSGDVWSYAGTSLRRTEWDHYLEHAHTPSGVARLHRLRPIQTPEVTPREIRRRIALACDRLVSSQLDSGAYLYQFHPFTLRDSGLEMNLVRQAGCTYGIAATAAAAAKGARRTVLRDSAVRSVNLLLGFGTTSPQGRFYIATRDDRPARDGALGAVALLLLALQFGELPSTFASARERLTASILAAQDGDGSFHCDLRSDHDDRHTTKQNFYPGEALLALTYEAERGRPGCAEAIARSFPWYRDHFRRAPATAFVLWHVDTWRRAHALAERGLLPGVAPEACASFVFEMVDWILRIQYPETTRPADFAGGFSPDATTPGFSSSTYAEAVIRGYALATSLGDAEQARAERYRAASVSAVRFLFRLQIVEEMAPLFRNPRLTVGGTTASLRDFNIRNDFDQHTITALLAALEAGGLAQTH